MHLRPCLALVLVLTSTCALAQDRLPTGPRRTPGATPQDPARGPRPRVPVPPLTAFARPQCTATTSLGETLWLQVDAPLPGATVSAYEPDCPTRVQVTGLATLSGRSYDFYFILDSSGSTGRCTGEDIDGDGHVGVDFLFGTCDDPGDTVLAAEVAAVRGFVATLSPVTARVALIQFSSPDATFGSRQLIVRPLTSDFVDFNAGLDEVMTFGSAGPTDYGGALLLLEQEYLANADPVNRRQFAYFLSDGVPTYPVPPFSAEDMGDSQAAIDAADVMAAHGVRIDTFGVGFTPSITLDPVLPSRCVVTRPGGMLDLASTLECVAFRTGGSFFASNDPADIVDELRRRQPTGIESVTVFNDTNGTSADAALAADGSYVAEVPVEQGIVNVLRVVVVSDDGTTCEAVTDFLVACFAAGCSPLTQGYWHRQCLGLGLIPTNGNMPPHPDWDPQVLLRIMASIVDPQVAALGSPRDTTACEGLDADPQNDACQKAIKQFTAVLMNMAGGHLGPGCMLELDGLGFATPEEARAAIALSIQLGLAGDERACRVANDWADAINTGAAVR